MSRNPFFENRIAQKCRDNNLVLYIRDGLHGISKEREDEVHVFPNSTLEDIEKEVDKKIAKLHPTDVEYLVKAAQSFDVPVKYQH